MRRKLTDALEEGEELPEPYRMSLIPGVSKSIQEFYKGECQYCGASGATHVDHIIAKSKGGTDNLKNYILACDRCNQKKGNGDIAPQFLGLITAIADKNKDHILARIKRRRKLKLDFYIYKIGLAPNFCSSMIIHYKPTMEEYLRLKYLTDLYTEARKVLDQCKINAQSPATT